jgi:hypothetical protein
LGKKFYNSLKIGPNFVFQFFKNKIIYNFVKFVATKEGMTSNFFSPLSFVLLFGSGIRDKHPGFATLLSRHLLVQQFVSTYSLAMKLEYRYWL